MTGWQEVRFLGPRGGSHPNRFAIFCREALHKAKGRVQYIRTGSRIGSDVTMAAKIRDIAKKLNISVSTVSYALNNGPRPVPERVRDLVLQTAREMDYRPNRIAKSLSARRSFVVGYVPARPSSDVLAVPYTHTVLNGIMNRCEEVGYDFLVFAQHGHIPQAQFVDLISDGRVDGLIFAGDAELEPIRIAAARRGLPYVVLSAEAQSGDHRLIADNWNGIVQAVEHLAALGHTRIGCMGSSSPMTDVKERLAAVRSEFARLGIPIVEHWFMEGRMTIHRAEEAFLEASRIGPLPTAVMCLNDEMAVGVMRACYRLKLAIPDDLSVVGFDNFLHALAAIPPLTTVRQPVAEMGARAVTLLLDLIDGKEIPETTCFATELIVRESTAAPKMGQST